MLATIKRLNRSKTAIVLIMLAVFSIMLYCNFHTALTGDDYTYFYNCYDDSKIDSVWDIFVSMYYHRYTTNGRVIPHFFVQLFLMLPLPFFKVLNTLVFCIFVYTPYYFGRYFGKYNAEEKFTRPEHNALLLATVFACIWVSAPAFSKVFLWLDGSINYLWCEALCLIWLLPWAVNFCGRSFKMKPWQELLFCVFSLITGNYSENSSVSMIFMAMLFIGLTYFYKHEKIQRWQISSLIADFIGFFFLAFAPAELKTKIGEFSLTVLFDNFTTLLIDYLSYWPILLLYGFFLYLSYKQKEPKEPAILSLVLLAGSLAAQFILVFALYYSERSTYLTFTLLLLACIILMYRFFESRAAYIICAFSAVYLCLAAYWGYVGIKDISTMYYRYTYNDELIRSAAANGMTEVEVPYILPDTDYCSFYQWQYLRMDPEHYINQATARYYGIEKISGFFYYDTE